MNVAELPAVAVAMAPTGYSAPLPGSDCLTPSGNAGMVTFRRHEAPKSLVRV